MTQTVLPRNLAAARDWALQTGDTQLVKALTTPAAANPFHAWTTMVDHGVDAGLAHAILDTRTGPDGTITATVPQQGAGRPRRQLPTDTPTAAAAARLGLTEREIWVRWRKALGLSRAEVARRAGAGYGAISYWENGRSTPGENDHDALVAALVDAGTPSDTELRDAI